MDDHVLPEIPALEAIQKFDPPSVARTSVLGSAFDFSSVIPLVRGIVELFRQIPLELLVEMPDQQQAHIRSQAEACWGIIQEMLRFDPNQVENATAVRQGLISRLQAQYSEALTQLGPVLAYGAARSRDQGSIEVRAAELLERASAAASQIEGMRVATTEQAKQTLAEVRKVAAEAGVSQQATYFDTQANKHSEEATTWQTRTYITAGALASFALAAGILGYMVVPENAYQAAQLAISKLLIFSTIAFVLYLSSRTLMAHRHNEVVNRHRQNALLTFNALADAAMTEQTRDVVLTHASQCIFAPQESGFSRGSGPPSSPSMVEIVPKVMGAEHIGG